ncbi:hypothetical protein CALVIDRAFT_540468 [Calocera viscosa TUFC12733]|uniref:Uncharacterized protein n=1 Tax=Calocera viscosa (strain TUFC12733) TaxID=1330018 RepID=A0A167IVC9_CALVF|nr:hypothetical protein CALVIDRAFT_540468 [Calocera viscosa TUFC12733]
MRASTAVLFTAAIAASSLAAPVLREDETALDSRGVGKVVEKVAKHFEKHGGAYKTIAKTAGGAYNAFNSRDIEDADFELSERDFEELAELDERELDEVLSGLDERSLFSIAGKLIEKGVKHEAKHAAGNAANNQNNNQNKQRSLEDDEDLEEREFDEELEERNMFGMAGKFIKHGGRHGAMRGARHGAGAASNGQEQPQQRSLEDEEDLEEREFDEELEERNMIGMAGKFLKHGGRHGAMRGARHGASAAGNSQEQPQQRSLEDIDDEMDFEMRDVDELNISLLGRSVPEDELEWVVDMRDVEGEEDLEERSKIGNFFKKIGNGIKKGFQAVAKVIL